jgi:hypothetical protein
LANTGTVVLSVDALGSQHISVEGMSGRRDRPARRSEAGSSPVIFRRIRQHNRTRQGRRPTIAWDRPSIVVQVLKALFRTPAYLVMMTAHRRHPGLHATQDR